MIELPNSPISKFQNSETSKLLISRIPKLPNFEIWYRFIPEFRTQRYLKERKEFPTNLGSEIHKEACSSI